MNDNLKISTIFPNVLTDFGFYLAPHYNQCPPDGFCAKLEMKLVDCMEAYGLRKSRTKCAELLYDMIECRKNTFQRLRCNAIRRERMRQYREGKLDKPFDEYPTLDSYLFV